MDRNYKFRLYQVVDQFNFLSAGMSGNMSILENNFCAFGIQLVDTFRYRLLISRNWRRRKDNGIRRSYGNFLCVPFAILLRAAMLSPWLPVVMITVFSSG